MSKLYYFIFIGIAILMIASGALFIVDQRRNVVIFQFGEAVRVITKPGLHVKIPFIQDVVFFDNRILNVTAEAKELTASDGKRVIVDAFAKVRIVDPVTFFKTVYNYEGARLRINRILESAMRKEIGKVNLMTLLSDKRSHIMLQIRDLVDKEAKYFGVDVVDVKILKADLPNENSNAIYRRMQTGREKEAKLIRAEGKEEAAKIRSKADKESKILLAEAYMQAQRLKGEGDSEAAKIYNKSYAKDPEFYNFYKSMLAYKDSFSKDNTSFVLSPKSDFFKYLKISK